MAETKIHYMHDIHSGAELIFCDNSAISYPLHNHVSVFTVGMVLEGSVSLRVGQSSKIYGKDQILPSFRMYRIVLRQKRIIHC